MFDNNNIHCTAAYSMIPMLFTFHARVNCSIMALIKLYLQSCIVMHIRKWHTVYHFKMVHIILIYSFIFTLQERMCQHANLTLNTSCHYYCGFSYQRLDQRSSNCAVLPVTTKLQEHLCPPVYPSVRLSVCHNFSQCSSDCNNMKFYYHWQKWCLCKRSKSEVKVTEVKTNFAAVWAFPDRISSSNSQMATKWCTKLAVAWNRVPIVFKASVKFQGHTGRIIDNLDPNWAYPDSNTSLNTQMVLKWSTLWGIISTVGLIRFRPGYWNSYITKDIL